MKKLWGNVKGLKTGQLHRLNSFYRRRIPPQYLISLELNRDLTDLAYEIQRQIGLLIDRAGHIAYVLVGDFHRLVIPELTDYRIFPGRLRGVRLVHTHLNNAPLSAEDLTDLALLRLDLIAAVAIDHHGLARQIDWAHILPAPNAPHAYKVRETLRLHQLDIDCLRLIQSLEAEMASSYQAVGSTTTGERALLISVSTAPRRIAMASMQELTELSTSGGIVVVGTVIQQRKQVDARFLIGRGKLNELTIRAMQHGATLLIFDQDLNPSQIRSITDLTDLKVIDRTQLILDIFAQRARSREGKLQVELAQLKYLLPRLVTKNTAMSRLTGGIGGRGPGETKLEINRRRVRERVHRLEEALRQVQKQRAQQRRKRRQKRLPIISIIGYTNAGKSTLLNTMTQSQVLAESRLFATLDPSSRRLRFPSEMEVIITDTVGFIRNLPKDLMVAFRATLEELENADLLLHVIDISNPHYAEQIQAVEKILEELELQQIPQIRIMNKMDCVDHETVSLLAERLHGIAVCAHDKHSLTPLIAKIVDLLTAKSMPDLHIPTTPAGPPLSAS